MTDEVYTIDLRHSTPEGTRTDKFRAAEGWELDRLDNGVLILANSRVRTLVEYSPYAWQAVTTENIDLTEDVHD